MKRYPSIYPLIFWAKEREAIRLKRLAGLPAPWTTDEVLQRYRFCNLRRSDDRVSQWLINNLLANPMVWQEWSSPGFNEWSFIQFVALGRWINYPPTLIALREAGFWPSEQLDLPSIGTFLDGLKGQQEKVWTGAYMIRAPTGRHRGLGKGAYVATGVIGEGLESVRAGLLEALRTNSLARVWGELVKAGGFGSFMSAQVVVDLAYSPLLSNAVDLYTWAVSGPGSSRGFARLRRLPLNKKINLEEWNELLLIWRERVIAHMGPEYNDLLMMDIQNALCETDKYLRVLNGEGRPRADYWTHEGLY